MTNKTMEKLDLVTMPRLTMEEKKFALMAINIQITRMRQKRKEYRREPHMVEKIDKVLEHLLEAHRKIGW